MSDILTAPLLVKTERVFLGWEVPALRAAARVLAERYATAVELRMDGVVVALPGARAGRRLAELLVEEAESRGLPLVPPRVATVGALPELLHTPALPPAEPLAMRLAWVRALRARGDACAALFPVPPTEDDASGWLALARQLERLHALVGGAGMSFDDVAERCAAAGLAYDDSGRWRALGALQREYLARLTSAGVSAREAARREALATGSVASGLDVWLVGVVEMPAVTRGMLERLQGRVHVLVHAPEERSDGFDSLGCVVPGYWHPAEVPVPTARMRLVDGPTHQALEAERILRGWRGAYAAEDVTIGVPDEGVVPYLEQRLEAIGVPTRYAAGAPVARSAPYRLLEAVAEFVTTRRFDAFAALLRHPDVGRWLESRDGCGDLPVEAALEAADRHFMECLPADLYGSLAGSGRDRDLVQQVLEAVDGLLRPLGGPPRPHAEWAPELLGVLAEAYGARELDRGRDADRRLIAACERLLGAAAAMSRLPRPLDALCPARDALRLLLAEAEGESIPPEAESAAVELLGWLELHLDDAPALIVTGANEPPLPGSVTGDPFLPNALCTRLGIPDNEHRYARDVYLLSAMHFSRAETWLVAGRRTAAGDPVRVSRLLLACSETSLPARVLSFYAREGGDGTEPSPVPPVGAGTATFSLPPEPVIVPPEPITSLAVTDFRAMIADPYGWALSRVLRLERVEDAAVEMDALRFGSLVHDVLAGFSRTGVAHSTDAAVIRAALDHLFDAVVRARFGRRTLPAVRLQLEQARARLHAFADWQARRAGEGWRTVAWEVSARDAGIDVDGERFGLRGRIDRVDHHAGTDRWVVLDYKTSEKGDGPDATHRTRTGEWLDLQLPLYRWLLPHARREEDGSRVVPDDLGQIELGYVVLPGDPACVGLQMASWTDEDLESADEAAREVVRFVRGNRFAFDPSVTRFDNDPLNALLGVGLMAEPAAEEA